MYFDGLSVNQKPIFGVESSFRGYKPLTTEAGKILSQKHMYFDVLSMNQELIFGVESFFGTNSHRLPRGEEVGKFYLTNICI